MREEKKEDSGSTCAALERGRSAGQQTDPEKGPTGAVAMFREVAKGALFEHIKAIVDCILVNIKKHHLPSAKLLVDLVTLLEAAGLDLPAEAYMGFAEALWRELEEAEKSLVVEGGTQVVESQPGPPVAAGV
jgi:hypothetical protein